MKVPKRFSVIFLSILVAGLIFSQAVAHAYHDKESGKGGSGKAKQSASVKVEKKLSKVAGKAQQKANRIADKLGAKEARKTIKEVKKAEKIEVKEVKKTEIKEKVTAQQEKGNEAGEKKVENRYKENKGRLNAFQTITDKLNDSAREILKGLQNALNMISKWFGIDRAVEAGKEYNQTLQDQK